MMAIADSTADRRGVEPRMNRLNDAEDKRLIAALAGGDDRALGALIDRWHLPLRQFVFRFVQQAEDTEDLVQETFVRVFRHRERYRPESKFSTWLFTIAVNLCRNHAARRRRRPTVSLDDGGEDGARQRREAVSLDAGPHERVDHAERVAAVRAAIGALPADLRTAVLLFEYEHLSHAEIATIESTTPKAIETRLYRARQRLRKSLSRFLGG